MNALSSDDDDQETANHSEHSFAQCYWLHMRYKHLAPTQRNQCPFPINTDLKFHATQLKQQTQTQTHPLHDHNAYSDSPKNMKATIFNNNEHTNIIISEQDITPEECRKNLKHIGITITLQYLSPR